ARGGKYGSDSGPTPRTLLAWDPRIEPLPGGWLYACACYDGACVPRGRRFRGEPGRGPVAPLADRGPGRDLRRDRRVRRLPEDRLRPGCRRRLPAREPLAGPPELRPGPY